MYRDDTITGAVVGLTCELLLPLWYLLLLYMPEYRKMPHITDNRLAREIVGVKLRRVV